MRHRSRTLLFPALISIAMLTASTIASGAPSPSSGTPEPFLGYEAAPTPLPGQASSLTPDMLSGLRLRNIGPAVMSGRFVDIEVVESDPYEFIVASSTGGRTGVTSPSNQRSFWSRFPSLR